MAIEQDYVAEHATELDIDPKRLAIAGDSVGDEVVLGGRSAGRGGPQAADRPPT